MARIISIKRNNISAQTLHNIGVAVDESYIANGIVVHNCKSYIVPILKGNLGSREIEKLKPSKKSLEQQVQFSEHDCGEFHHV
jgi:hypothetical protein